MSVLHTVNKSPFERNALESCLRLAKAGSSILLFEDGVIAAMQNTKFSERIAQAMHDFSFYVMGPDVKARGLGEDKLINGIQVVDYNGFVDLATEHDAVQSWL
ncbi:MAG: sulfurtransferase complex subunit TusB [Gammaproteobacteria bacterium]|nr:sulfurtransferase complex subunit TusB [Gammaproteobacteria bacterium]MDE0412221.1 sulfurtransferase complex subunit TusB [Gammaproteobacteria bacterium]